MDASNGRVVAVGQSARFVSNLNHAQFHDEDESNSSASSTTRGRRRFRRRPPPQQPHPRPPALGPCYRDADESTLTMRTREWLSAGISEVAIRIKDDSSRPDEIMGDEEHCKAEKNHDESSISSMSSFGDDSNHAGKVIEGLPLQKPDHPQEVTAVRTNLSACAEDFE